MHEARAKLKKSSARPLVTGSDWSERAKRALDGEEVEGVEVLRGRRPRFVDAFLLRGLATFAAVPLLFWAALERELAAGGSLDPLALLLRTVAAIATVRAALVSVDLVRRARLWMVAGRWALAIGEDGLWCRGPGVDVGASAAEVVGLGGPGAGHEREVYVVLRPGAAHGHLALPPVFDRSPDALHQRLGRWWKTPPAVPTPTAPAAAEQLFDEAAVGRPTGGTAVRHGWRWVRRGPFAAMLLGVAILDGLMRTPPNVEVSGEVIGSMLAMLLLLPVAWIGWTRLRLSRSCGVAFVLTPGALLVRAKGSVTVIAWDAVTRVWVQTSAAWSVLGGLERRRALVVDHGAGPRMRWEEALLEPPVEVARAFVEAWRAGRATSEAGLGAAPPAPSAPDSARGAEPG